MHFTTLSSGGRKFFRAHKLLVPPFRNCSNYLFQPQDLNYTEDRTYIIDVLWYNCICILYVKYLYRPPITYVVYTFEFLTFVNKIM